MEKEREKVKWTEGDQGGGGRRFTKGERKGEGICRKSGGKTLHNLTIKV